MASTNPSTESTGERGGGDDLGIDISGFVRRVRRLADLSQRELAARLGIDQPSLSRIEGGDDLGVRTFTRVLAMAGLRLIVVDDGGNETDPMPADVFRDRAGRRKPAHLDVHAWPERATMKMLLHSVDPVKPGEPWHHLRPERDRLREQTGRGAGDEQLSAGAARARRRNGASDARSNGASCARSGGARRGDRVRT